MAKNRHGQAIPTQLGRGPFEQFVLPHLSVGRRGPAPKLSLFKIFNYILQLLYLGCQWKELAINKDGEGRPEIHLLVAGFSGARIRPKAAEMWGSALDGGPQRSDGGR